MDIYFEQFSSKLKSDSPVYPCTALDWRGLAARLAAAHATRQILAVPDHCTIASGSFAPHWAADVAAHLAAAGHQPDKHSSRADSAKCESSARAKSLLSHRLTPKTGAHFLARYSESLLSHRVTPKTGAHFLARYSDENNYPSADVNQIVKSNGKLPSPIADALKTRTR